MQKKKNSIKSKILIAKLAWNSPHAPAGNQTDAGSDVGATVFGLQIDFKRSRVVNLLGVVFVAPKQVKPCLVTIP